MEPIFDGVLPEYAELLDPPRTYTRAEVLASPSPVPRTSGIYGWYFDEIPDGVPVDRVVHTSHGALLYVGISPKAPPAGGARPSAQTLRDRIRYHYRGNAEGSTLRLTLGCHLTERLGIQLRRVGSGTRLTWTARGEQVLNEWMQQHARVAWVEHPRPWLPEEAMIRAVCLPLNLGHNAHSPYYPTLKALRALHKKNARDLPPDV
ncbi:MAG: GIY-YIG nuclease family protein [Sporichthyaceae bacterium]